MGILSPIFQATKQVGKVTSTDIGAMFSKLNPPDSKVVDAVPATQPVQAAQAEVKVEPSDVHNMYKELEDTNLLNKAADPIEDGNKPLTDKDRSFVKQPEMRNDEVGKTNYNAGTLQHKEEYFNARYVESIGGKQEALKVREQFYKKFGIDIKRFSEDTFGNSSDPLLDMYIPIINRRMTRLADSLGLPTESMSFNGMLNILPKNNSANAMFEHIAAEARAQGDERSAVNAHETASSDVKGVAIRGGTDTAVAYVTDYSHSHEWFHHLDEYLGALDSGDIQITQNGVMYHPSAIDRKQNVNNMSNRAKEIKSAQGIRQETFDAWHSLNKELKAQQKDLIVRLRSGHPVTEADKEYFIGTAEHSARAFEKWVHTVKQKPTVEDANFYSQRQYPTNAEIDKLAPLFETLFKSMKTQKSVEGDHKILYGAGGTAIGSVIVPKNQEEQDKGV